MSIAHTVIVGAGTLVSRLLGVVRDATIAWLLGGSGMGDAFAAAVRIPYLMRRLLGEGTLSLSVTVACIRESLKNDGTGQGASALALAVTRRVRLWGGLLTLLLLVGAGGVIAVTAPGLGEASSQEAELAEEAILLFRICIPYAFFALLAAGNMAALHTQQRFLLPSLTPALFNLAVLTFAGLAVLVPGMPAATLLACGVLCGGLLQWLAQLPALRTVGRAKRVEEGQVREVMRRIPAGILGAAMPQLAFLVASVLASLLPEGHIAALFYAERLLEFPLGVLGAAVGMVAAPRLATLGARNEPSATDALAQETCKAVLLACGLNLPAAAGLMAVAMPLVSLVLGHGAFDTEAVTVTALALCAYAPGLPAYALSRPLLAVCHAVDDARTPLRATGISLGVTAVAGYALLQIPGDWGRLGPPLGVSLGLWCFLFLLWRGVRVPLEFPIRAFLWQGAGAVCTFAVAHEVVAHCTEQGLPDVVSLALAIPLGMLTYALVLLMGWRTLFLKRNPRCS